MSPAIRLATVSSAKDSSDVKIRLSPLGPKLPQHSQMPKKISVIATEAQGSRSSAAKLTDTPAGGRRSGSKIHTRSVVPLDRVLPKTFGLSREVEGSRISDGDSSGSKIQPRGTVVPDPTASQQPKTSSSKIQPGYRIPRITASRDAGVPGTEDEPSVITTVLPRRDVQSKDRAYHRHRHHKRLHLGCPPGKVSHHYRHAKSTLSSHPKTTSVTHHPEPAAEPATSAGPEKPKSRVISLTDYRERKRKLDVGDPKDTSESCSNGAGAERTHTHRDYWKSSLAESNRWGRLKASP